MPVTPISIRLHEPMYEVPLVAGESIHLGYTHITEERAFVNPPQIKFAPTVFDWPRTELSCDGTIRIIRKFVWANDAFFLVPKPNTSNSMREAIYDSLVAYTDNIGRHVRISISLHAHKRDSTDIIVLDAHVVQGETRAFNKFHDRLKLYIESRGEIDPQIYFRENAPRHPFPPIPELKRNNADTYGKLSDDFELWPINIPTNGLESDNDIWLNNP